MACTARWHLLADPHSACPSSFPGLPVQPCRACYIPDVTFIHIPVQFSLCLHFYSFFSKFEIQFPFHALQLKALHPLITHVRCFGLNFPLCFLENMMSLICFIFMQRKVLLKFRRGTFTTSYPWINWNPIKHMKSFSSQKTISCLPLFPLAPAVSRCKVKQCLYLLKLSSPASAPTGFSTAPSSRWFCFLSASSRYPSLLHDAPGIERSLITQVQPLFLAGHSSLPHVSTAHSTKVILNTNSHFPVHGDSWAMNAQLLFTTESFCTCSTPQIWMPPQWGVENLAAIQYNSNEWRADVPDGKHGCFLGPISLGVATQYIRLDKYELGNTQCFCSHHLVPDSVKWSTLNRIILGRVILIQIMGCSCVQAEIPVQTLVLADLRWLILEQIVL